MSDTASPQADLIRLTAQIVGAHVSNNRTEVAQLAPLVADIHNALANAIRPVQDVPSAASPKPAVPIRSSIAPDYLVCLEDGAKVKMLKRYLRRRFDLTPEQYRARWKLPADYPMIAPNYAEQRRTIAAHHGFGGRLTSAQVGAIAESADPSGGTAGDQVVESGTVSDATAGNDESR